MANNSNKPEVTAVSWTGGKDCNLSLLYAHRDPSLDVRYLINFRSEGNALKAHPVPFMEAQAASLNIPLIHVIFSNDTKDYKQAYVDELRNARDKYGINVITTGDMDLVGTMKRNWIQECCELAGEDGKGCMRAHLPLWQKDRTQVLEELFEESFEIIYSCVKSPFFDGSWINRTLNRDAVREMELIVAREMTEEDARRGVKPLDLCGERGEYHTMCVNGPLYKKRVDVKVNDEPLREDLKSSWKGNIHNADTIWMISLGDCPSS